MAQADKALRYKLQLLIPQVELSPGFLWQYGQPAFLAEARLVLLTTVGDVKSANIGELFVGQQGLSSCDDHSVSSPISSLDQK